MVQGKAEDESSATETGSSEAATGGSGASTGSSGAAAGSTNTVPDKLVHILAAFDFSARRANCTVYGAFFEQPFVTPSHTHDDDPATLRRPRRRLSARE